MEFLLNQNRSFYLRNIARVKFLTTKNSLMPSTIPILVGLPIYYLILLTGQEQSCITLKCWSTPISSSWEMLIKVFSLRLCTKFPIQRIIPKEKETAKASHTEKIRLAL